MVTRQRDEGRARRRQRWRARARHHAPYLLLWSVLCALFFAPLLLDLAHLPPGDFTGQFHAFASFQARELAQGRLPLWSPGSFAGFPFAGDPQSAAFYPLRWLAILLSLPWGFSLYALQVEAMAHIWLAGVFTYGLAYALTRSAPAALLGAVAFALGGYLTSYPLQQLAILETIAWLPLLLLLVRRAALQRRPLPPLAMAGLVLGVSFLAGHPQTFLHVAYVTAAYFVFCAYRARWSWRWMLGGGALLALMAAGMAAAGWLPALRWLRFSTRAETSYEFVSAGQELLNALQLFVPNLRTVWAPEYAGMATLLLALLAWSGRGSLRRGSQAQLPAGSAEVAFWAALAVLAAWLSLGDGGLLFRLFYRLAPGFSLFRQQERLWGLVSLSLALLAAQGVAITLRAPRRRRLRLPAVVVALGLLVSLAYLLARPQSDPTGAVVWARQMLLAALALGLLWWRRPRRWWPVALVLLLAADLYLGTAPTIDRRPGAATSYWQEPPWLQTLQEAQQELQRVDTENRFMANVGERFGLEDVRGISPLKPRVLEELEQLPRHRFWQLLGVSHVVTERTGGGEPPPGLGAPLAPVTSGLEPGRPVAAALYPVQNPLPRAWLSYEPQPVSGAQDALQRLAAPDFDPARWVLLHGALPPVESVTPPATPPQVEVVRLQSNALRIHLTTETPALLVLGEWRYPGWRATVDGATARLYPANYAFQTLPVPAGEHVVELRYSPTDVFAGLGLSALTLALALLLVWRWRPVVSRRESLAWLAPGRLPALPPALERPWAGLGARLLAHWRLLLLAIVVAGFALRLFHLGVQELRGDEAFSYLYAQQSPVQMLTTLLADGDPHPPLHYVLLAGWTRLTGDSEWALRYPSAMASVLLLSLLFQLGRRVWDRRLGLLLAGFMTFSQSQIWLAQDARSQYMLSLLFSTLATLLLLRALQRPAAWRWALYALACALAMYGHYYSLFALLAHGAYVLAAGYGPRRLVRWALSGVGAFLLLAPWLAYSVPHWRDQLGDPGAMRLESFLLTVSGELLAGPALAQSVTPWLVLMAILIACLGAVVLWQRRPAQGGTRAWAVLFAAWLGGAALGIYLILLRRATFNPFYIAVAAPAWWLLFAAGVLALWQARRRLWRLAGVLALLSVLALSALGLARYYGDPVAYGRTRGYRALAAYLEQESRPGDLFLAHFPDPALVYYLRHQALPYLMQPARAGEAREEVESALAAVAEDYERILFLPQQSSVWNRDNVVARWLDYHSLLERDQRFQDLALQTYRPLHTVPEIWQPLGQDVAGQMALTGAYLTADGAPLDACPQQARLFPGAAINTSLIWRALAPIPTDYTVFVHFLAEDGRLLAQHDGVPAHGTRPTGGWSAGEEILDEHLLTVPPEAAGRRGRLVAGLYETETLQRQAFSNGEETILLCNVTVAGP